MANSKRDLWSEFSEDEDTDNPWGKAVTQKDPPANDGSEWVGKYDRRSIPRDEESDSGDEKSD